MYTWEESLTALADKYLRKEAYARAKTTPSLTGMVCLCTELEQSDGDLISKADSTATEDTLMVNHMKSQYQRQKTQKHHPRHCKWCGKDSGNCFQRQDKCAAWSNVLENCIKRGHYVEGNSLPSVTTQVEFVEIGSVQMVGSLQWDNHKATRQQPKTLRLLTMKTESPGP